MSTDTSLYIFNWLVADKGNFRSGSYILQISDKFKNLQEFTYRA